MAWASAAALVGDVAVEYVRFGGVMECVPLCPRELEFVLEEEEEEEE